LISLALGYGLRETAARGPWFPCQLAALFVVRGDSGIQTPVVDCPDDGEGPAEQWEPREAETTDVQPVVPKTARSDWAWQFDLRESFVCWSVSSPSWWERTQFVPHPPWQHRTGLQLRGLLAAPPCAGDGAGRWVRRQCDRRADSGGGLLFSRVRPCVLLLPTFILPSQGCLIFWLQAGGRSGGSAPRASSGRNSAALSRVVAWH